MLENLLNTKLKKKLLGIFFTLPQRSFSIFELKQLTDSPGSMIQKALREFVSDQVISVATKAQKRYFRVNPRFRLYDEVSDLIKGSGYDDIEDEVIKTLKRLPNVRLAILTGIFSLQPQVSVDLLLVGDQINRIRLQQILSEIENWIGQEIGFSIMNEEEYEYRQMMNDRFIRDILDHPYLLAVNFLK